MCWIFRLPVRAPARAKPSDLSGKVVVNLFFEPSTRTRMSFSLAARRLGADVLDFSPSGSSTSKGETFRSERQGRRQSFLRALDANANEFQPGGSAAGSRCAGFFAFRFEHQQGRNLQI